MKIGFLSIWDEYNKKMFSESESFYLGDDLFRHFKYLKRYAKENGLEIGYAGDFQLNEIDAYVFHLLPSDKNPFFLDAIEHNKPMFLFIDEPESVFPIVHDVSMHGLFKKVFSPYDLWVDGKYYVKVQLNSYDHTTQMTRNINKEKLCVIINSNKLFPHPLELNTERMVCIKWFEKHRSVDFDLYGFGWDVQNYPSYRGTVKSKNEVLSKYKFSICFENFRNSPGYITEKIFDCFFAGCVPIYLGATNIEKYIPSNCFIDYRQFHSYESLVTFLEQMPDEVYSKYLDHIESFLNSGIETYFSQKQYAETITNHLLSVLENKPLSLHKEEIYTQSLPVRLNGVNESRSLGWWIIYARQLFQNGEAEQALNIAYLISECLDKDDVQLNPMISKEEYKIQIDTLIITILNHTSNYEELNRYCEKMKSYAPSFADTSFYKASSNINQAFSLLIEASQEIDKYLELAEHPSLLPNDPTLKWQTYLLRVRTQLFMGNLTEAFLSNVFALRECPMYFGSYQNMKENIEQFYSDSEKILQLKPSQFV